MHFKIRIFRTAWINILVIFLAVYAFLIITEIIGADEMLQDKLMIGFVGSLFSIFGYGFMKAQAVKLGLFHLDSNCFLWQLVDLSNYSDGRRIRMNIAVNT